MMRSRRRTSRSRRTQILHRCPALWPPASPSHPHPRHAAAAVRSPRPRFRRVADDDQERSGRFHPRRGASSRKGDFAVLERNRSDFLSPGHFRRSSRCDPDGEDRGAAVTSGAEPGSSPRDLTSSTPLDRDLSAMSLVCRSWSWPAQRALGRVFCLCYRGGKAVKNALRTPVFGAWTREIILLQDGDSDEGHDDREFRDTICLMLPRLAGVKKFSLCSNARYLFARTVSHSLHHLTELCELNFIARAQTRQHNGISV